MKQHGLCWSILASFSLITFLSLHVPCFAATSWNDQGMVATVHPLATKAGVNALRSGGNAVDAAVA
ncbi:MAG: hypothetical protein QGG09_05665, partial [Pirellulaceae bacterium]|nr:hypothetical protein [Pirellulaceae bacterium]